MTTILLVEDEKPIREMVQFTLSRNDFKVFEAENAKQAFAMLAVHVPDLILLDLMLPGTNGLDLTRKLKQQHATKDIPIIMLTARAEEESKVRALEIGADDYVVKPFSPKELVARIKAVLRRGLLVSPGGEIWVDQLCLNTEQNTVKVNEVELKLTAIEYKILHFFITHQERSYSRAQILNHIWGGISEIDERTVDVQMGRVRKVLKPYGYDKYLVTVRGFGYKFSTESLQ